MIKLIAQKRSLDKKLLGVVIGLTLFGVLMVYNASVAEAARDFQDKFYYLKYQALWALIGLSLMLVASLINYKFLEKISFLIFFVNLLLLIIVLFPGIATEIKGAKRWLNLGIFSIQPSELIKLTFVIYLASWLKQKRSLWQLAILIFFVLFLIILEPDLGTAVAVTSTAFLTYFASGASIANLLPISFLGVISGLLVILGSEYRRKRLLTFFDASIDPLGTSYHVRQILIALGSGGLFGLGLGQSRQKYAYLPEASTDSIFAIIAEEIGFVGSMALILALFYVVYRGLKIAKSAPDIFGKILASGISIWIGVQTIINLSAMVALVPLTGLPLPFISYGGSSLIVVLLGMGILLNISKYQIKEK